MITDVFVKTGIFFLMQETFPGDHMLYDTPEQRVSGSKNESNTMACLSPQSTARSVRDVGVCCLSLMLLWAAATAAAQNTAPAREDSVVSAYQTLVSPGQTLSDRTAAARYLLRSNSDDAEQAINSALVSGQDPEAWRAVLLAIASDPVDPPSDLALQVYALVLRLDEQMVSDWADAMGRFNASDKWRKELERTATNPRKPMTERVRAITALGRFREKTVARSLVGMIEVDQPIQVQHAAFDALAKLTGIETFNADRNRWNTWHRQTKGLNDARWHRHLVENFTRRAAVDNARQQELEDRLLESQRALYRTTAPQERSAVLAYMLGDPLRPIRELGMDLVQQRLVGGQGFDEPLRQALRARLSDSAPSIRQRAALRLRDLADEPGAGIVAQRLADGSEQVASVLRANLLMMATLPREIAADASLTMLSRPELRADAAGALATLHSADLLSRKQANKARQQLRRALSPNGNIPAPQEIILLAAIGDDDDWNRIAGWVDHLDPAIKQAAATAWAGSDRSLKLLAERAADPVIQPIVITAAIRRGNDPWTLLALTPHRPDEAQAAAQWRRAIVALASRVPPDSVLKATDILSKRGESAEFLDEIYSATIDQSIDAQTKPAGWPGLVLRRAQTRMALGNAALAAADYEKLANYSAQLSERQRDQRDRGLIQAYLLTSEDDKATAALLNLLGDGSGGLRARATDDPIIVQFIDAADRHAGAGRGDQALALLDRLRDLLGSRVSPVISPRINQLRTQLERDKIAESDTGTPTP